RPAARPAARRDLGGARLLEPHGRRLGLPRAAPALPRCHRQARGLTASPWLRGVGRCDTSTFGWANRPPVPVALRPHSAMLSAKLEYRYYPAPFAVTCKLTGIRWPASTERWGVSWSFQCDEL